MKRIFKILLILAIFYPAFAQQKQESINLEDLNWIEAEKALQQYEVVLIALGARSKEHGPHLLLKNDYLMAEYLKERVMLKVSVVVLPTLQYGYYPAFLEYPGSISISKDTFKNFVVDICESMSRYGKNKFYILNTGVSTLRPLASAKEELNQKGIKLCYFNILEMEKNLPKDLLEQKMPGTHADEVETSMMLYIAPKTVDMSKAVKNFDPRPNRKGGLTRNSDGKGYYSPTGVAGNPTLASKEKGKIIVEATIEKIVREIEELIRK